MLVDLIFNKSLEGGFFIEAGAWDGECSNCLLKVSPSEQVSEKVSPSEQVKPSATRCSLSWTMGNYLNGSMLKRVLIMTKVERAASGAKPGRFPKVADETSQSSQFTSLSQPPSKFGFSFDFFT